MRCLALLVCLAFASPAGAQVGLPPVRVPPLPAAPLSSTPAALPASGAVDASVGELDPGRLRELHALRVRELLRRHRDVLETDPHGAPIVRRELLAFSPQQGALELALAAGYSVGRGR